MVHVTLSHDCPTKRFTHMELLGEDTDLHMWLVQTFTILSI